MKRLWVRLSLMISGVLFFMFFMQFLTITLERTGMKEDLDGPPDAPPAEIQQRLIGFMAFSVVVGLGGGIIIGRVVSAPITELVKAADKIGKGDLNTRVFPHGSQEMIDLADRFNKMAQELEHAETLKNNLMADVAHELRTPLTVLEANLRAALDKVYSLDEAEIANLFGQTRHLTRLVNDLRELALAESKQLHLEKYPTDLNALLAETIQALDPLAAEKSVQLIYQPTLLPELSVDPTRIRQAVFNLLSNALRHTPSGGKISVAGKQAKSMVVLSIKDSGEGLLPDQLAAVFDRFYRADKSRSRETGGTGLGLAIVKAIIESHGGQVKAYSEGKGKGSEFTIILPK
ncbi:ATP-binding protein [Candidatus Villigracilis saccharophilus]|uniref:HAMP domain-containing sensor histidine kinase n=1 Tax=Candidatus Villigracilis saccharophilus TaxID=3140684 RepID=UPI003135524B|nr:HAMP domain-containing protein [Anaerolineales bacterium]